MCLDGTTADIASFGLHPKAEMSSDLRGVREAEMLLHQDEPVSPSREMLCHVLHCTYYKQLHVFLSSCLYSTSPSGTSRQDHPSMVC